MAQPLRKIRQRIAPSPAPRSGFSLRLPPLAVAALCVVMLASTGWAFFMGYMVGHGQNPGEEVRELTGIGQPDRETLAEMDKALADAESSDLRDKLASLAGQPAGFGAAPAPGSAAPAASNAQAAPDARAGQTVQTAGAAAPAPKPATGTAGHPFERPSGAALAAWGQAPSAGAAQDGAKAAAPARQQAAALYDFVFQVAAFRNTDDADRLRQRLEGRGLRTRGQKSGKLTLVMVHMRGTDQDAADLKEELQRMRLGSPLQKSKKQVGGKPRPR